jgi:hypothetical protein
VQRRLAHARLEVLGRALGDEPAARDDPHPVGELLGLLEVLGGQEDGGVLFGPRRSGKLSKVTSATRRASSCS